MADPQHPDIAALVERANARLLVMSRVESPTYGQAANGEIIEELRDALRTLARPVEDEEVRRVAAALGDVADWFASRYTASANAEKCREAASLLARLARERDALAKTAHENGEGLFILSDRATRAEQEVARLRDAVAEARRLIGFVTTATDAAAARVLERALAAAAGTDEPR